MHAMRTMPFLVDINECVEETDGCTQNCTNTNGSYICSCNTGYRLDSDRHSCYGKFVLCDYIIVGILEYRIQILASVKRELTSALKYVPTPLVPMCVSVMLATCWALTKLPAMVRPLRVHSILATMYFFS